MTVKYLVDTSAYVRLARESALRDAWRPWFAAGTLAVCPLTELEIFFAARSVGRPSEGDRVDHSKSIQLGVHA
ncbi:PIN domain-containing protein [Actinoplanes flavus]|uniref:PIN domain-containing protein n=1 Tax=Actinoplanes flavus TaxID=2820290 RepID=UPI003557127C